MNAPSNSTPNSDDIVTGLNANQNSTSDVLATMNNEMPDPKPYPFFSMSSSRITMHPAPISCATITTIVAMLICEGCPYAPYQMAPTTSPKQKMSAITLSSPSASFSSFLELILRSPMAVTICNIHPAEMMGEMPNSMRVPLLEAMITLAQQSGSASWERSMPQRGIWEQMMQMKRAMAVNMVRWSTLRGAGGLGTVGKSLAKGRSTFKRFIVIIQIAKQPRDHPQSHLSTPLYFSSPPQPPKYPNASPTPTSQWSTACPENVFRSSILFFVIKQNVKWNSTGIRQFTGRHAELVASDGGSAAALHVHDPLPLPDFAAGQGRQGGH